MQAQTNVIRETFDRDGYNAGKLDERIRSLGDSALDQMLLALQDEDATIRAIALTYLRKMGDSRAVEPIVRFIYDETRYDRDMPSKMPPKERLQLLFPGMRKMRQELHLNSRKLDLRHAATTLGMLGSTDAVEALRFLSNDKDEEIRATASEALVRLGAS